MFQWYSHMYIYCQLATCCLQNACLNNLTLNIIYWLCNENNTSWWCWWMTPGPSSDSLHFWARQFRDILKARNGVRSPVDAHAA